MWGMSPAHFLSTETRNLRFKSERNQFPTYVHNHLDSLDGRDIRPLGKRYRGRNYRSFGALRHSKCSCTARAKRRGAPERLIRLEKRKSNDAK